MSDKILVVNGSSYAKAIDGLGEPTSRVSQFMDSPEEFKLVLFTGGSDVDPKFYGDTSPMGYCYSNPERDIFETAIYKRALKSGIPMTGICRGLQFLNVMNGGKMLHHINGHEFGTHNMTTSRGEVILVNTLHHQMILPPPGSKVVGWCTDPISDIYIGQDDKEIPFAMIEYEAAIYLKTKCFGVQYHPEMMSPSLDGYQWYYNMVKSALEDWEKFCEEYNGKRPEVSKSDSSTA